MCNNKDIRWETESPRGGIYLDEERWGHIQNHHPIMDGNEGEEAIKDTVETPDAISSSDTWQDRVIYFKKNVFSPTLDKFIKVVVDENQGGRIITSFPQDNILQGTGGLLYVDYDNS